MLINIILSHIRLISINYYQLPEFHILLPKKTRPYRKIFPSRSMARKEEYPPPHDLTIA